MNAIIETIIGEAMFTRMGNSWTYTLPEEMYEKIAVQVALEAARIADHCISTQYYDVGDAIRNHFGVFNASPQHPDIK